MERGYAALLARQFRENRQMVFLSGPRQVGKTTLARQVLARLGTGLYLNWDNLDDRELILAGSGRLADALRLDEIQGDKQAGQSPLLVLDELHKYSRWKSFIKGFFDHYEDRVHVLVTGCAPRTRKRWTFW